MKMRGILVALLALGTATGCGSSDEQKPDPLDVSLPKPENGFQFETGAFSVPQGSEIQNCFFFEVPSDVPLFVHHFQMAQNEGSHHMNLFRVRTIVNLDAAPGEMVHDGECWNSPNWADWPLVANSQLPGEDDFTMPDGVAMRFEPHEKLMLQTHFVNASTQKTPLAGKVIVNFDAIPESAVENELGTVFATNQNIEACPGDVNRKFETTCRFAKGNPVTIIAANGHFHSRGRSFTINSFDPVNGKGAQFYESTQWDEPVLAHDLSVPVPEGGGIDWTCEFTVPADDCGDPNNNCCYTFGGYVESQEHCNAFVYYYPRGPTDFNCF
jgi:hypothetical protein